MFRTVFKRSEYLRDALRTWRSLQPEHHSLVQLWLESGHPRVGVMWEPWLSQTQRWSRIWALSSGIMLEPFLGMGESWWIVKCGRPTQTHN